MAKLLVNVDVDNLAKAVAFYRDALGLEPGRRLGEGVVEMLGAEAPVYLLEKPSGTAAFPDTNKTRNYARHWTPVHLDFVVPDIRAALDKARTAGAHSNAVCGRRGGAASRCFPIRSATGSA